MKSHSHSPCASTWPLCGTVRGSHLTGHIHHANRRAASNARPLHRFWWRLTQAAVLKCAAWPSQSIKCVLTSPFKPGSSPNIGDTKAPALLAVLHAGASLAGAMVGLLVAPFIAAIEVTTYFLMADKQHTSLKKPKDARKPLKRVTFDSRPPETIAGLKDQAKVKTKLVGLGILHVKIETGVSPTNGLNSPLPNRPY